MNDFIPNVPSKGCLIIFGVPSLLLFASSFATFSKTKRCEHWLKHTPPVHGTDVGYIMTTFFLSMILWIGAALLVLLFRWLLRLLKMEKVGRFITHFGFSICVPMASVYLGMVLKDILDFWSVCLLIGSLVCGVTAFRNINDFGIIDSFLGVALSIVVNIHGNIKEKKHNSFHVPWHIQFVLVGLVVGGRAGLLKLRDFILQHFHNNPTTDIESQVRGGIVVDRVPPSDADDEHLRGQSERPRAYFLTSGSGQLQFFGEWSDEEISQCQLHTLTYRDLSILIRGEEANETEQPPPSVFGQESGLGDGDTQITEQSPSILILEEEANETEQPPPSVLGLEESGLRNVDTQITEQSPSKIKTKKKGKKAKNRLSVSYPNDLLLSNRFDCLRLEEHF